MHDSGSFQSPVLLQFRNAKTLCVRKNENFKSYAQVATSVRQQVVRQKSCGLKPGESKPCRLIARFTQNERATIVRQAAEARLTISELIRASVLGPNAGSSIDPEKHRLLRDLNRELSRQGNNLNQIARHLNAGIMSPDRGASSLDILTRSLLSAHKAVREALAQSRAGD